MPLTNWLWSGTSPAPPNPSVLQNQPVPSCYREIVAWDSFAGAFKDHRVLWGIVLLLLLRFVSDESFSPRGPLQELFDPPGFAPLDHPPVVAWVVRAGTHLVGEIQDWGKHRRLGAGRRFDLAHQGSGTFSRRAGLRAALLFHAPRIETEFCIE